MSEDMRIKLSHMGINFNNTLKKCEGKDYDYRLFIAKYKNLVNAVEEFYRLEAKNSIIHVAFNDMYAKKFDELRDLEKSLKDRGMI
ncbi:hypothetical protein AV545_04225 [Paenibacillus jamilae]|uniref:hypothetical protein n=1 Tax=Paenibacillus jamilae TaxID=114136 RepID=UPI0007AB640A|nr:hypothetical protein [Paenibacillus jamilae]KZE65137.1 hypothetical protein AV545_04225 [Paenibacillus jamilae]